MTHFHKAVLAKCSLQNCAYQNRKLTSQNTSPHAPSVTDTLLIIAVQKTVKQYLLLEQLFGIGPWYNNDSNSGFSYCAHVRHSVTLKALQHSVFTCKVCGATLMYETYSFYVAHSMVYKVLRCNMQSPMPEAI